MLALPVEILERIVAKLSDEHLFTGCKASKLWFLMVRCEAYKRWAYYLKEAEKKYLEIKEVDRLYREGQLDWKTHLGHRNSLLAHQICWTKDQLNIMEHMLKKGMISDPDEKAFIEHSIIEWSWGTTNFDCFAQKLLQK